MLWFGVILTLALVALGIVLMNELDRALIRDADARLDLWWDTVAHKIEEYPEELWDTKLRSALPDTLSFAVWNAKGRSVASGLAEPGAYPSPGTRSSGEDDRRIREGRTPLGHGVRLHLDISTERSHVRRLMGGLALAACGILLVALAGGWFVVSRTLAPIRAMTAAAEQISRQDLTARIDPDPLPAEIQGLAQTLNESFARLEEVFERQARFTADASHELRTPLSIVHAQLELALLDDALHPSLRERLEAGLAAAQRMRSVVEGLLTLAREDAGSDADPRKIVRLDVLAEDVVASSRDMAEDAGLQLGVRTTPLRVVADEARLRDCVSNLVVNAIRHHGGEGRVDVEVSQREGEAILRVVDDGVGVPPEHQARVFERFYRVDKSRSRAAGGSGLGLAIARGIVEGHGGRIMLSSSLTGGASFTITLPLPSGSEAHGPETEDPA